MIKINIKNIDAISFNQPAPPSLKESLEIKIKVADKNIQKKDIKAISLKLIDDFLYIVNIKYMKNKGNEINRVYISI